jgi:hypothetical protein
MTGGGVTGACGSAIDGLTRKPEIAATAQICLSIVSPLPNPGLGKVGINADPRPAPDVSGA